jgi:hypothetical protein
MPSGLVAPPPPGTYFQPRARSRFATSWGFRLYAITSAATMGLLFHQFFWVNLEWPGDRPPERRLRYYEDDEGARKV